MRGVALATPATLYFALVTTAGPNNFLAGVEVSGGSYARVGIISSLAAWAGTQGQGSTGLSTGFGGASSNNNAITFPAPTGNWGSVVGWEAWDAATLGNRWLYDVLTVPKTVSIGDPAVAFPVGELRISFV